MTRVDPYGELSATSPAPGGPPEMSRVARTWPALAAVLAAAMCLCGCTTTVLEDEQVYGRVWGALPERSMNGVAVLARMLEDRGHRVSSWNRLSPRLDRAQVLFWFPDNFQPPSPQEQAWLEHWLKMRQGTLVYVGRDFDSQIVYWQRMLNGAPADQDFEMRRRLAHVRAKHDARRAEMPRDQSGRWFHVRRDAPKRPIRSLTSPTDRADGIDPAKLEMTIEGRLDPPDSPPAAEQAAPIVADRRRASPTAPQMVGEGPYPQADVLLASQGDPLVMRLRHPSWGNGQIISVVNGSFLLNLPLVNHEHRKLAERLIGELGSAPDLDIVFLESTSPLTIRESEEGPQNPTGFEFLQQWPLAPLAIHLLIALLVACLVLYPVFGRPQETSDESVSDFGRHIDELGRLLASTGDVDYARQRLDTYWSAVRRDASSRKQPQRQE